MMRRGSACGVFSRRGEMSVGGVALCAVLALWLTACSQTRDEPLARQSSADVSCNNSAVFGFESGLFWVPTLGTVTFPSSRRMQGNASLRVQASAHAKVTSVLTCTPAATWATLALYVA